MHRSASGEAMQDALSRASRLCSSVELSGTHDSVGCEGVRFLTLDISVSRLWVDWQHILESAMTRTTRTRRTRTAVLLRQRRVLSVLVILLEPLLLFHD